MAEKHRGSPKPKKPGRVPAHMQPARYDEVPADLPPGTQVIVIYEDDNEDETNNAVASKPDRQDENWPLAQAVKGDPLLVQMLPDHYWIEGSRCRREHEKNPIMPAGDQKWIQRLVDRGFHRYVNVAPAVCSAEAVRSWVVDFAMKVAEQSRLWQIDNVWRENIENSGERLVEAVAILTDELAEQGLGNPPERQDGPASAQDAKKFLRSIRDWLDRPLAMLADTSELQWSVPKSPQEWATKFNLGWDTLKKHFDSQVIRNQKLTSKSYRVHIGDLPADASR